MSKNITPLNSEGLGHGLWEIYYDNGTGKLWYKGSYINGLRHGYWECYLDNGELAYKGNYMNGMLIGYWVDYCPIKCRYNKEYYI